ncbi:MAG: efflux RND transporter periplasmic adaptor subunit [Deltaproteobacteria bacterium]|nr:efflux RND transporter periplasmic adaptor subunit [Deltaproteobacteria bacterium]
MRACLWTVLWVAACSGGEPAREHDEHEAHGEHEERGRPRGGAERGRADADEPRDEVHLSAEAIAASEVRVGRVERRAIGGGIAFPAEIQFEPTSTAHVGPLVSGRFTRVAVSLGQEVRRGQLLGVLASSDVSQARSRLQQARARLAAAEAAQRRQEQLIGEGIGARRGLVEAEAQVRELRAEIVGLQSQLSVFGSGRSGELSLRAPIDGVIVQLHATLGETAGTDEPAFVITDPSRVSVRGSVPELEVSRVAVGMRVVVRLHAFPDLALAGGIAYVAPALDEASRSLPIRVTLDAADARLRSGLFGSIELVGGEADQRPLVVPADAVATVDGQPVVFVPAGRPGAFRPTTVTLGRRAGAHQVVSAGLTEGAAIVTNGAFVLMSALRSGELSEGHAH